jgi:3-phenylpropionate/trans-cinnamate dioxygenase ferredoxin reductase component
LQIDAEATPFTPVPFFWSDQYDRKIQLAGRPRPDDDVPVATGSLAERRFAAMYGRAGKLVAVLGFNRPRHVAQFRQLIVDGVSIDDALAFAAAI